MRYAVLMIISGVLAFGSAAQAQTLTQNIRGQVIDADSHQPLSGATIALAGLSKGAVCDSSGHFMLPAIAVGRYQIEASFVGYESLSIPEVVVESGKETVLTIELSETSAQLNTVEIRAARTEAKAASPMVRTLTVEETLRFPATFFDPARLVTSFAGVAGDNDQANGIAIRGNSPNGLLWRLEGLDIVNPNHTPNAGTFSDRVTANGGGVIILSAQLLATSDFYTGAFPVGYGNALSGVMDMRLRKGNEQRYEFTAQTGLIGLDIASEGPLSKRSGASYLINYRYSTLGLLSAMGLDLGDEAISFQDLSFNLAFPFRNGSQLTFFGMGGISNNIFEATRDSSVWEFQKDRFDIIFGSRTAASGLTFTAPVGKRGIWRTVAGWSGLSSTRTGDRLDDNYTLSREEKDTYGQQKLSVHSYISYKLHSGSRIRAGLNLTRQSYDVLSWLRGDTLAVSDNSSWVAQPYLNWRHNVGERLVLNAGLHGSIFTLSESAALEPRLSLAWQPAPQQTLSLAYGLHSQIQQPQLYFSSAANGKLLPTRAHHIVLGYEYAWLRSSTLRAEVFYQSLFDVPISADSDAGLSYSALNALEEPVTFALVNKGLGRNYGLELSWQQLFTGRFYYLLNSTLYSSTYQAADGTWRSTRYNGNFILNATLGREWAKEKNSGKVRIIGLNGRMAYIGGFRTTPIDATTSSQLGQTVYFDNQAFSIQQPGYLRLDLRVYWKWNRRRSSSMLALDIQNASNARNVAFSYYDTQKQAIVEKYQLGLIPLLSYRVSF